MTEHPLYTVGYQSVESATFAQAALGLAHRRRLSFPAARLQIEQVLPLGDPILAQERASGFGTVLIIGEDIVLRVEADDGEGTLTLAARTRDALTGSATELLAALHDPAPCRTDDVPLTIWATHDYLPKPSLETVTAPAWNVIRDNYEHSAAESLDELMTAQAPGPGRLVLMHGPPGTGKSYAIRALAREWKTWCDTHVVADADDALSGMTHLHEILGRRPDDGRFRLLVIEDAGEMLSVDAREKAGHAVSRLLNVTDGLASDALRTIVLVTTNEPVGRLHPAIVRPGRCWAQVEIPPLPPPQADAWLCRLGVTNSAGGQARTLAELFALADGRAIPNACPIGFAA